MCYLLIIQFCVYRWQNIPRNLKIVLLEVMFLERNQSVVNVKQCSKRGLNDQRQFGLLFVSILVALDIVTSVTTHFYPSFFKVRQSQFTSCLFTRYIVSFSFTLSVLHRVDDQCEIRSKALVH